MSRKRLKANAIPSRFLPEKSENSIIIVDTSNDLNLGTSYIANNVIPTPSGTAPSSEKYDILDVSHDSGHDYVSPSHSDLWSKYNQLLKENSN